MIELDEVASLRQDVPEMSERARATGRWRLHAEFDQPPRHRVSMLRLVAVPGLVVAVITAGLTGYQVFGPSENQPAASAAETLRAAAGAIGPEQDLQPRPDQYLYREMLHVTSDGSRTVVRIWESADGTRAGEVRIEDQARTQASSPGKGTTPSNSPRAPEVSPLPPYIEGDSLANAPYLKLASLPTDPAALLALLDQDPQVRAELDQSTGVTPTPIPGTNKTSREVAVWRLIRSIVDKAPSAQQAALFRTAALLPGLITLDSLTDAAGRNGVTVGMNDPHLGMVGLLFDKTTHRFLGEPITSSADQQTLSFNAAVQRIAVVDKAGQLP